MKFQEHAGKTLVAIRTEKWGKRPIRFATFLAPSLLPIYQFITEFVGHKLGQPTELFVGTSYDQMVEEAEVGFICGLPYVYLRRRPDQPVEPVAAPVLSGSRYGGRPIYFSDVIVRRDSPFRTFADLRGCRWSFNEPFSQSGYGIVRDRLLRLGQTASFFGDVVEAGWHQRSINLVCAGEVDASAIDSHVLAIAFRDQPSLARRLRILETFGPSTIQPVVANRRLPSRFRKDLQSVLLEMEADPAAKKVLDLGFIQRFVAVGDDSYDEIRRMLAEAEKARFMMKEVPFI